MLRIHLHNSLWWLNIRPPSLLAFVAEDYKRELFAAPCRLPGGDYQRKRARLSSQDTSIVLQIGSRWSGFGRLSQRKIALREVPGREGARLHGWDGIPEFLNCSRLGRDLKGWRPGLWDLVVVIVDILKAKWTEVETSPPAWLNSLWFLLPGVIFPAQYFYSVKRICCSVCRRGFGPLLPPFWPTFTSILA